MALYEDALRRALRRTGSVSVDLSPPMGMPRTDLDTRVYDFWVHPPSPRTQPAAPTGEQLEQLRQAEKAQPDAPGNPVVEAAKGVGKAALWLLDVGNRYVTRPVVGAVIKAVRQDPDDAGKSFTQVYEETVGRHWWAALPIEIILDPLNLTGIGLVGKLAKVPKVAKALEASAALRKGFEAAQLADEAIARTQALPVTGALWAGKKVASGLEKLTGKPLFQKTARSRVREEIDILREYLRRPESKSEFRDWLKPEEGMTALSREEVLTRFRSMPDEAIKNEILNWDSISLIQAWDTLQKVSDPDIVQRVRPFLNYELLQRGLMERVIAGNEIKWLPTERLARHLELEDALMSREIPHEARRALHDLLDAFAVAMFTRNPDKFRRLDDVYGTFTIDTMPFMREAADQATDGQTFWQKTKASATKVARQVFGQSVDEAIRAYEQTGSIPTTLLRSIDLEDFAKTMGVSKQDLEAHYEVIRRGFEALTPEQRVKAINWYQKWGTFIAATFPRERLPDDIIEQLLNQRVKEFTREYYLTARERSILSDVAKSIGINLKTDEGATIPWETWQRVIGEARRRGIDFTPDPNDTSEIRALNVVISDVNPLIETARRYGYLTPENISDEMLARLGLTREDLMRSLDEDGMVTGDVAKRIVADRLRNLTAREIALAAWAAGGQNQSPLENFRTMLQWVLDIAHGRLPQILEAKEAAAAGLPRQLNRQGKPVYGWGSAQKGADRILYDVLFAPNLAGIGSSAQRAYVGARQLPFSKRFLDESVLPSGAIPGVNDKIWNYWKITAAYADLFDEAIFPILAHGDEEVIRRAHELADAAFYFYVNDRHMKRDFLPRIGESFDDWYQRIVGSEDYPVESYFRERGLDAPTDDEKEILYRMYYYLAHRELKGGGGDIAQWLRNESNTQALIWFIHQLQWSGVEAARDRIQKAVRADILQKFPDLAEKLRSGDEKLEEETRKLVNTMVNAVMRQDYRKVPQEYIEVLQNEVTPNAFRTAYDEQKRNFNDLFTRFLDASTPEKRQALAAEIQKLIKREFGDTGFSTPREFIQSGYFDDLLRALETLPPERRETFLRMTADGTAALFRELMALDDRLLTRAQEAGGQLIDGQRIYTLLQDRLERIRGAFQLGNDGPVIRFSPFADVTTVIHELAHLLRYAERGSRMFEDVAGEENFAQAVEALLAQAQAGHPRVNQALRRLRRFMEIAYARGIPTQELTPEEARRLLSELGYPDASVIIEEMRRQRASTEAQPPLRQAAEEPTPSAPAAEEPPAASAAPEPPPTEVSTPPPAQGKRSRKVEPEPQQVAQQQAAAAAIMEPAAQAAATPRMEPGDLIDSLSKEIKRASDWDRLVYPLLSDIKYQGDFLMKDGGPLRRLKWPSL